MKTYKMRQTTKVSYEEAKELIKGTGSERDFDNLNESTKKEIGFEVVQDRSYYVTKIAKKGTIWHRGTPWETKVNNGFYVLEMVYNYRHPTNFALNQNNVSRYFKIAL